MCQSRVEAETVPAAHVFLQKEPGVLLEHQVPRGLRGHLVSLDIRDIQERRVREELRGPRVSRGPKETRAQWVFQDFQAWKGSRASQDQPGARVSQVWMAVTGPEEIQDKPDSQEIQDLLESRVFQDSKVFQEIQPFTPSIFQDSQGTLDPVDLQDLRGLQGPGA